jgi:hypothetical protein
MLQLGPCSSSWCIPAAAQLQLSVIDMRRVCAATRQLADALTTIWHAMLLSHRHQRAFQQQLRGPSSCKHMPGGATGSALVRANQAAVALNRSLTGLPASACCVRAQGEAWQQRACMRRRRVRACWWPPASVAVWGATSVLRHTGGPSRHCICNDQCITACQTSCLLRCYCSLGCQCARLAVHAVLCPGHPAGSCRCCEKLGAAAATAAAAKHWMQHGAHQACPGPQQCLL